MNGRFLLLLAGVFVLALGLRVGFVVESAEADYYEHLVLDSATYHRIAVTGDPAEPFWQPPGYPWVLRGVYALAGGPSPLAVRLLQAALGALSCAVLVLLIRRLGASDAAALAGGLAAAVCGSLVYFDGELLPASLATSLLTIWCWAFVETGSEGGHWRRPRPVVLGLLLGALGLLLPSLALVGLPCLALLGRREGWRRALFVALLAALVIVPVTIRNLRHEADPVAVSWNAGLNFYIGNAGAFPATVGIRPGIEWQRLSARARCEGRAETRAAESRWYVSEALSEAAGDPLGWGWTVLRKAAWAFSGREIGRNREPYLAREESLVIRLLLWPVGIPFLVLGPAAAVGAAALIRRREWPALLALVVLGVLAASVVFFPTARYRAPALPALIALAALGLPRARPRDLVAGSIALAVALLPCSIPRIAASETAYEIGVDLAGEGRHREAIAFFREALTLAPGSADAELVLGLSLARGGDDAGAKEHLRRAVELEPSAAVGWQSLAMIARREGRGGEALELLEQAVEADRCARRVRVAYAGMLMESGYYQRAEEQLAAARRVYPRADRTIDAAEQRLAELRARFGR